MAKTKAELAAWMREDRKKDPDRYREYDLKRHYGLTLDDYQGILQAQNGACAICGKLPGSIGTGNNSAGTLAVDHSHKLSAIRGLLCTNCNLGLGSFFEESDLLRKAADYIDRHEEMILRIRKTIYRRP